MPKGSAKGRITQYLSDAIKKMKVEGHVWVNKCNADGTRTRVKLIPPPEYFEGKGLTALIKGKGRFRWATITEKDGIKADTGHCVFHVNPKDIVAVIEE